MKLVITKAYIPSVVNLGENHGDEIVSGTAIKVEGQITPQQMAEFDEKLPKVFFNKDEIPILPHLGPIPWTAEYENALVNIDGAQFTKGDLKKILFDVKAGFLVDFTATIKVNANKDQRGHLAGLVKQTVKVSLSKMTQKEIEVENDEEEDEGKQQDLPGTGKDGQPITPLIGRDGKTQAQRDAEKTKH